VSADLKRMAGFSATAEDLARTYGVAVGTIYRWASEDGWRRSDPRRRPVTYNRDDAEESYGKRHGTA
jgi:uncharacterized protein YjcR